MADKASGPNAFAGTEFDALDVKQQIYERSKPPLLVDVAELSHGGVRLLVISVPSGVDIHADTQGGVRQRIGRSCLPMTAHEQAMRIDERRGVDWSASPSSIPVRAVSAGALNAARGLLRLHDDDRSRLAQLADVDLLRSLGVVDGEGRLLRAGAAMFCDRGEERPWIVYQYRPTPSAEATAVERLAGPMVTVLQRLTDLVWARRHTTAVTLRDGSQFELADFPREAVREAAANAILHREHQIEQSVSVEHSPHGFVVESPGRLVSGITESNILTHPSKPRNPCLFQAARKLRMAEETGRGIDRIYRELIRAGRDTPSISQTQDSTRVAFTGGAPRTQLVRFIAGLGSEGHDVDALLVIFTLLNSRTVTASTLQTIIQKTHEEAAAVLKRLASSDEGILEATLESRRRRDPTYRLRSATLSALGSAVSYQRHDLADTDRKVIDHINDYGRINNRTIQDMFNLNVYRASTLLRDLQDRKILIKTTNQQRGPGVEYGPGPNFPSTTNKSHRQRPAKPR